MLGEGLETKLAEISPSSTSSSTLQLTQTSVSREEFEAKATKPTHHSSPGIPTAAGTCTAVSVLYLRELVEDHIRKRHPVINMVNHDPSNISGSVGEHGRVGCMAHFAV